MCFCRSRRFQPTVMMADPQASAVRGRASFRVARAGPTSSGGFLLPPEHDSEQLIRTRFRTSVSGSGDAGPFA